jgi:hypothetical protein
MPINVSDLIARIPGSVERTVKQTRDKHRSALQEAMRSESRLQFRMQAETDERRTSAQVPIGITPGLPVALATQTLPDNFERVLAIGRYRIALEKVRDGGAKLEPLRDELSQMPDAHHWVSIEKGALQSTSDWAERLLRFLDAYDPLKRVLAVDSDILGAYFYDADDMFHDPFLVNRANIQLYWGVIGLLSGWLGASVEDLTIVVLTHELAHAYTQLGADIQGYRWPAATFAKADHALKEGLAQYYTHCVLMRLKTRYTGALDAFQKMLPKQPEAYRSHTKWVTLSPEAVRRAMLEVRRQGEGKLVAFEERLRTAQASLVPNDA